MVLFLEYESTVLVFLCIIEKLGRIVVESCIGNVWETCKRRTWTHRLSVLGLSMLRMVGIILAETLWLGTA